MVTTAQSRNLAYTDLLMNPDCTPKIGQCDLLYGSKSSVEKACSGQLSVTIHVLLIDRYRLSIYDRPYTCMSYINEKK